MIARTSRSPRIVAQPEMSGWPLSHSIGSAGGDVSARPPSTPVVPWLVELSSVVEVVVGAVVGSVVGAVVPVVPVVVVDVVPVRTSRSAPVSVPEPCTPISSAPLTMLANLCMVASQISRRPITNPVLAGSPGRSAGALRRAPTPVSHDLRSGDALGLAAPHP